MVGSALLVASTPTITLPTTPDTPCTLETSSASSTPRRCLMSRAPPKVLSPMRAPRARLAWESMKPDAGVMPAPQPSFYPFVDESQQRSKATLF